MQCKYEVLYIAGRGKVMNELTSEVVMSLSGFLNTCQLLLDTNTILIYTLPFDTVDADQSIALTSNFLHSSSQLTLLWGESTRREFLVRKCIRLLAKYV